MICLKSLTVFHAGYVQIGLSQTKWHETVDYVIVFFWNDFFLILFFLDYCIAWLVNEFIVYSWY